MATTRGMLASWFDEGVEEGHQWMVIRCDAFDHSDYPSYHDTREDTEKIMKEPGKMQRVMEVYKLDPNFKDIQLGQYRCYALNMRFDIDAAAARKRDQQSKKVLDTITLAMSQLVLLEEEADFLLDAAHAALVTARQLLIAKYQPQTGPYGD